MGVYNWRGEILWIVDLAMLLGASSSTRRRDRLQPTIIINDTTSDMSGAGAIGDRQSNTLGLVVDEIAEIEWCELDPLGTLSPDDIQPELAKWMRGVWRSDRSENFLGLDRQAIFAGIAAAQTDRI
jgi:positive phototaxis protein PixI